MRRKELRKMEKNDFGKSACLWILICGIMGTVTISCASAKFRSDTKTIELKGNPTTGYTWVYEIEDESIILIDEKIKYLGKKNMVGSPSLFTYTIKSRKPGTTELRFEYKRPWEDKSAEEKVTYSVTVDESGKIEIGE